MASAPDGVGCSAGIAQTVGVAVRRLSRPGGSAAPAASSRPPVSRQVSGFERVLSVCDELQVLGFCLPSEFVRVRAAAPTFGSDAAEGLVRTTVVDRLVDHFLTKRKSHFGKLGVDSLHDAAELGDYEAAWAHLHKGASPNTLDRHGSAPLHYAAQCNHIGIYKLLRKAGADLEVAYQGVNCSEGWTPLHFAAYYNAPQVLLLLLLSGVEVNRTDKAARTATFFAKGEERRSCFRYLTQFGGKADSHKMEVAALEQALHHHPEDLTQAAKADGSDFVWDSSTDAADMFVEGMVITQPTDLGDLY